MRAAVPPLFCTSAMACSASVVLPLLSGPYTCQQAIAQSPELHSVRKAEDPYMHGLTTGSLWAGACAR